MTRITVVAHSHPAIRLGGGEVAAYREFGEMLRLGHEANFVGMTNEASALATVFRGGQRVVRHGPSDFIVRAEPFDNFGYDFLDIRDEDWLVEFLADFDSDVFHFHHFWNIGVGTIRRLRALKPEATFVITLHEYQAICAADGQMLKRSGGLCTGASPVDCTVCCGDHGPFDYILRWRKLKAMLADFDLVLSPSEFLRERFIAWGLPADAIRVLENGLVHESEVDAAARDHRPQEQDRASRFAYFGQATATKGLNVLVDAAAHLAEHAENPIAIDVFGVTKEGFALLWPDKEVPANVTFRGRYQPAEAVTIMRRYGWIVMPSIWWENSPVVIQEARLAGVPMIASRLGGIYEKTAGWSLHFNVGEAVDLARVIEAAAGDVDTLRELTARIEPPLDIADFVREFLGLADIRRSGQGNAA